MTTTSETGSRARTTASVAADETQHVGRVAGEEMQNVAGETMSQVRQLADEARAQAEEQGRSQRDRLVSTLNTFSQDLDSMSRAGGGQGMAGQMVRMISGRARDLSGRLEGREPQDLLDDVRGFARRRPGTFLLGSLAAGVIAGRLLRGAKDSSSGKGGPSTGPGYDAVQAGLEAPGTSVTSDAPIAPTSAVAPAGGISAEPVGDVEPGVHRSTP